MQGAADATAVKKDAPSTDLYFGPSRWLWALATGSVVVFAGVLALSLLLPSPLWQRITSIALAIVALLGLVETGRRRLEFTSAGVSFVASFRRRFVPRSEIVSVTWAKGAGVSLKLANGTWVQLPELGQNSLALTNTIRAWLKRTTDSV